MGRNSCEVVCAETQDGDQVCIVGSSDALGDWQPAKALRLHTDSGIWPSWKQDVLQIQAGSEFKFLILRPDGEITWEVVEDNRRWPADLGAGACVCARFGEPGETVRHQQDSVASGGDGDGDVQRSPPTQENEPPTACAPISPSMYSRGKEGLRRRERILRSALDDRQRRLTDFYELEPEKLGEGAFGVVCACHLRGAENGIKYAVKTLVKESVASTEQLLKEIEITGRMDHPNCVRLVDSFEDERSVYMVLDACEGGMLFDRLCEAGRFCELDAAHMATQMLRAVAFVHSVGVCHRDLKPENFLLLKEAPVAQAQLKLIDFGLAKEFGDGQELKTAVGTCWYSAPEVTCGRYNEMCDLWSLGTIVFLLLAGRPPFDGQTAKEVLRNASTGEYDTDAPIWACVSQEAKDFIRSLLRVDAKARLTAEQGLEHPWIKDCATLGDQPLPARLLDNMQAWSRVNRFKRIAMSVVSDKLNHADVESMKQTFLSFDTNGDGHLTPYEIHDGLRRQGVSMPEGLLSVLEKLDSSEGQSGGICFSEFLTAAIDRRSFHHEELCWHAFKLFDKDNDGSISQAELRMALKHDLLGAVPDAQLVREAMAEADTDGDGRIDYEEFMHMMLTLAVGPPCVPCDDGVA